MEQVEALITELDSPASDNELRSYDFAAGTNVVELSQSLAQFFPTGSAAGMPRPRRGAATTAHARGADATGQPEQILFVPQPATRKIIVSAPTDMFAQIEEVIELLRPDSVNTPGLAVEFIQLKNGDASIIAELVEPIVMLRYQELVAAGEIPRRRPRAPDAEHHRDPAAGRIIVAAPKVLMPRSRR